jgi:hypothetical protein
MSRVRITRFSSAEICTISESSKSVWYNETRLPERPGPKPNRRRYVEALEDGIHGHVVAVNEVVVESNRLPVDDNEVHLGVRDADSFDRVFDRRLTRERIGERFFSLFPR